MKKSKVLSLAVAGGMLASFSLGAVAASTTEAVTAYINYNFKMKLNGQAYNPTESDGSAVRPLVYKGRTYLPVATLGQALGVAVSWDGSTSTVIIGENSDKMTDFKSLISKITGSRWKYTENKELLNAAGKTFNKGLVSSYKSPAGLFNDNLIFKPNGKYSKIGFTVATDDDIEISIDVVGDNNEIIDTFIISKGIQEVEFNIGGHKEISFGCGYGEDSIETKLVFGDIYFK